jgi:hypothetical protein
MQTYSLQHNRPLRIDGPRGALLECTAGTIWITGTDMAGDLFLRAGERRHLGGGRTLVEALGTAKIVLHPPVSRWQRILRAMGRGFLLSSRHEHTSRRLRTV